MEIQCPFCDRPVSLRQGKQAVIGRCTCGMFVTSCKGMTLNKLERGHSDEEPTTAQRSARLAESQREKQTGKGHNSLDRLGKGGGQQGKQPSALDRILGRA